MFALLVLPLLPIMTACAAPKPDIQPIPEVHNVYPVIPSNFLSCTPEPAVPQIVTDVQAAQFTEAVRTSGEDCRSRLAKVRETVASWPKP